MLVQSGYGKSRVRVMQVARHLDRHDVSDLTVAVRFQGAFDESYTAGNNRDVLPTDTIKNTVYALAAGTGIVEPEALGLVLARHFLEGNPRLDQVWVDLTARQWARLRVDGDTDDGYSFMGRGPDQRSATVMATRTSITISAGVVDLLILKTSRSAFSGFMRDTFTTLPETKDRLLATSLTATWQYATPEVEFGPVWQRVRQTMLRTFAAHESASVQHTIYAIGEAVIAATPAVQSIHLAMPNKHHLPVDLSRFGLANRNEVFVATDEPYGLIEATIAR
jgi:urate oxidase